MGSIFRMPIAKIDDASNFIKKVKDLDYKSIGFFPKAKEEYFNADLTGPIILTFGHEAAGLPVGDRKINGYAVENTYVWRCGVIECSCFCCCCNIRKYEAEAG